MCRQRGCNLCVIGAPHLTAGNATPPAYPAAQLSWSGATTTLSCQAPLGGGATPGHVIPQHSIRRMHSGNTACRLQHECRRQHRQSHIVAVVASIRIAATRARCLLCNCAVPGVTIYFSDFKRSLVDKLQKVGCDSEGA